MIYSTSMEDQPNLGIMHLVIYRVATAEVTFISVLPSTDECCWQVQRQTDTDRQTDVTHQKLSHDMVPGKKIGNLSCFRDTWKGIQATRTFYLWRVNHSRSPAKRNSPPQHIYTFWYAYPKKPSLYSQGIMEVWIRNKLTPAERSHNYWHHMIITQSLSPYKWQPASFTHWAQSEPNRTSAVSNVCSWTPSWLFIVQL